MRIEGDFLAGGSIDRHSLRREPSAWPSEIAMEFHRFRIGAFFAYSRARVSCSSKMLSEKRRN
jgi:hypothetical protein